MIKCSSNIDEKILANIGDPTLSVEYLSNELGVSQTTLWRYCKKNYGLTPKVIIDRKRLLLILRTTYVNNEHIYDVASKFGLENRCSFYNLTKKYFGECPKIIESNIILNVERKIYYEKYREIILVKSNLNNTSIPIPFFIPICYFVTLFVNDFMSFIELC